MKNLELALTRKIIGMSVLRYSTVVVYNMKAMIKSFLYSYSIRSVGKHFLLHFSLGA